MGIMDRDYWKNKGKPEDQTNKVSPRVKRAMDSLQESFDRKAKDKSNLIDRIPKRGDESIRASHYNPKEFRGSNKASTKFNIKWIYWGAILIGVLATIAMERGISIDSLRTKFQIIKEKYNGSLLDTIKEAISGKDIIPGILLVAQTDFKTPLKRVEIEIDLSKALENYDRYGVGQDFYYEKKGVNGSIGYRILSLDKEAGYVNGKVGMLMWGAESPFAASLTHLDNQVCAGNVVRGTSEKDDKVECGNSYAFAMSAKTRHPLGKNFKVALDFTERDKVRGFYSDESGGLRELGGFNLYPNMKPQSLLTHNLSFSGVISDCKELKPIEFALVKIKNGIDTGQSFPHGTDKNFECHTILSAKVSKGKILQSVGR